MQEIIDYLAILPPQTFNIQQMGFLASSNAIGDTKEIKRKSPKLAFLLKTITNI